MLSNSFHAKSPFNKINIIRLALPTAHDSTHVPAPKQKEFLHKTVR